MEKPTTGEVISTTKIFVERASKIHQNKYNYLDVEYKNNYTKVKIICLIHGEFWQTPKNHLNGGGCRDCGKESKIEKQKKSLEQFIIEANKVHNFKYDYTKTNYISAHTKIIIICKTHGEFEQISSNHLSGRGCLKCSVEQQIKPFQQFIEEANKVHNNKYDYSLVDYKSRKVKVKIICLKHGEFEQKPSSHLNGFGCRKCGIQERAQKRTKSLKEFIIDANKIHDNKYNYSKVENYKNTYFKINIICPEHGEFEQKVNNHLNGQGCPKCKAEKMLKSQEQFIIDANEVHNFKYDYSKVNYKNTLTKVKIICKDHGLFLQSPKNHLKGSGCHFCFESKGEAKIRNFLERNNINFKQEYRFTPIKNMAYDFYLPDYNMCIEFDGIQHFEEVKYWGGASKLKIIQQNDKIKNQFCEDNKIKLLRIDYRDYKNIDKILSILS